MYLKRGDVHPDRDIYNVRDKYRTDAFLVQTQDLLPSPIAVRDN